MINQNKGNPFTLFGSKIQAVLAAVRKANRKEGAGHGRFRVFPTNSGEAFHPQIVRRPKR